MDKEYKYKPGDFGDIKDMVRKANELSDLSWEERANDFRLTGSNEDTSVKTAPSAKKSASTAKNSRGKSSGNSRKSSNDATAKESKTTKKSSTKQKSEEAKQKAKVTPSNSSADSDKAGKTPSPTIGNLDALWNAAKASKAKKLKEEDQTQVWVDSKLLRQIELLNVKCGKPAPTKHVVNAILQMFLDGHRKELQKLK